VNQSSDQDLLREYADGGSEAAFEELTRRYVDLVYTAALRLVRDVALAEDVSQSVFLALARNCNNVRKAAPPSSLASPNDSSFGVQCGAFRGAPPGARTGSRRYE